jgi:1-acyl-sn-glycerol-3-phosphate acyltransferase
MAPEGTRSLDKVLHKGRQGPAYVASRAKAPLVPIGIINSDQFNDNLRGLRRTAFKVIIGRPFDLPDLGHRAKGRELEAYTELIMVQIANLLPERYHGYYAGNPALTALKAGQDPWPIICKTAGLAVPDSPDSAAK